ncbi:MAG: adenylosuccinate lyase [Gammaproteobacteria bacterium]|nr:MAG: adenylosuccinate lyase [Gammaproteobacteria bacterium]
MSLDPLLAITALDGRYRSKVEPLAAALSEFGLLHARVEVECRWFMTLAATDGVEELPELSEAQRSAVQAIYETFDVEAAAAIKTLERTTNHDVKAVEYFVKEKIGTIDGLEGQIEFVHFACTSEDINNLSHALMLIRARSVLAPVMTRLIGEIDSLATAHANLPMLSRTHGQPASPTTLGKEMANVRERLRRQADAIEKLEALGKMNGAVGNFNAHVSAYPAVDWPAVSSAFVASLGITHNPFTTQIEPHDYVAEWFHAFMRFNQVVLDFDRDIWSYISIDYFKQRKVEGETGSSTMPHKVNPIDFENSEGNLGLANALLEHMASKLPVSRWQRDLSDSTVLRNIGAALGHCLVAYESTLKGLSRLEVNEAVITADLFDRWEVLAEAVQTVMRRYGGEAPYEQLKTLTRGQQMDEALYREVLAGLDIPEAARAELEQLTPATYLGIAESLAKQQATES